MFYILEEEINDISEEDPIEDKPTDLRGDEDLEG